MKKIMFKRGAFGFTTGITIGYLITIIISLIFGKGSYLPCVPELIEKLGSEMNAILLQTFLYSILGIVFSYASLIWEIETWSIAKQTGVFLIIISAAMLPIAYCLYWMEHSLSGFLMYLGIFLLIFIIWWLIEYFVTKSKIKKLNSQMNNRLKK